MNLQAIFIKFLEFFKKCFFFFESLYFNRSRFSHLLQIGFIFLFLVWYSVKKWTREVEGSLAFWNILPTFQTFESVVLIETIYAFFLATAFFFTALVSFIYFHSKSEFFEPLNDYILNLSPRAHFFFIRLRDFVFLHLTLGWRYVLVIAAACSAVFFIFFFERFFSMPIFWWISVTDTVTGYFFTIAEADLMEHRFLNLHVADGLSLVFWILCFLVLPVCVSATYSKSLDSWFILLMTIYIYCLVLLAFMTCSLFLFVIAFEALLFPLFFIIVVGGSRSERVFASYMLYLFTLVGSIFLLLSMFILYYFFQSFDYIYILSCIQDLDWRHKESLWICLFIAFAFKVPLFPFHSWLTIAHVEAPTVGSIILASLLLKLGGYGLIRFVISILPDVSFMFQSFVVTLCSFGAVVATVGAFRQLDLKRFIAYTSIAHMHFLVLTLFTLTEFGYWGSIHGMLSHGLVAAGLFFLVGALYERIGVRLTVYIQGLLSILPVFSIFWVLFLFANAGLPFFSGFVSEFLGFLSVFSYSLHLGFLVALNFILGAVYAFLVQARVLFGLSGWWLLFKQLPFDLGFREIYTLVYLLFWILAVGLLPEIFLLPFNRPGIFLWSEDTFNTGLEAFTFGFGSAGFSGMTQAFVPLESPCATGNCGPLGVCNVFDFFIFDEYEESIKRFPKMPIFKQANWLYARVPASDILEDTEEFIKYFLAKGPGFWLTETAFGPLLEQPVKNEGLCCPPPVF